MSADPEDPEIQALRHQLAQLGPVPSRQALSHQEDMELWTWAEQEVAAGRVRALGCKQNLAAVSCPVIAH